MSGSPDSPNETLDSSTSNPALHGPILKSFLTYAIPSALGLLAMSTASVVDGIFIGRYEGGDALGAINLIIPVFSMAFGITYMLAVGGSVVAGKYVGENNFSAATNIFNKTLIVAALYALVLVTAGVAGSSSLFSLLGAEPQLHGLMSDYFNTYIWFLPFQIATAIYYFFVRIAGYPTLAATALVVGAVSNLLLDWWMIGVEGWGLTGAALASGISSLLSWLVLMLHQLKPDHWLHLVLRQRNWGEMGRAAFNGLSEFVNEISAGFVTFILNLVIIERMGITGVAAFSVVSYTLFIGLLLSFSISDSLQAVSSQCFGARNASRLNRFIAISAAAVLLNGALFITLLLTQGTQMIQLFVSDSDPQLVELAESFIQILWPVFIFNGLNMVVSAYLTAVHHALASAVIALSRSLIFPLGWLLVLTQWFPQQAFISALPLAEVCTLVIAAALFAAYRPQRVVGQMSETGPSNVAKV